MVKVISFGFKYGPPYPEAGMRIDLRSRIHNPQDQLPKDAVGTDRAVISAVLGPAENKKILQRYYERARASGAKGGALLGRVRLQERHPSQCRIRQRDRRASTGRRLRRRGRAPAPPKLSGEP
ncbi:RapZ C-terminal domain-containing protein [Nannocystis pusilla]|uniref:RapZ C-terminal domain-containing protein n=1 Tax=Nannocystis pusilla TaxID=889268 RepID=UPI003DA61511